MGHARALAGLKDNKTMMELARQTMENDWSVRELEDAIQQLGRKNTSAKKQQAKAKKRDPYIEQVEETLRERFKTTVRIRHQKDKGRIELLYYGKQDLERLLELLERLA